MEFVYSQCNLTLAKFCKRFYFLCLLQNAVHVHIKFYAINRRDQDVNCLLSGPIERVWVKGDGQ